MKAFRHFEGVIKLWAWTAEPECRHPNWLEEQILALPVPSPVWVPLIGAQSFLWPPSSPGLRGFAQSLRN